MSEYSEAQRLAAASGSEALIPLESLAENEHLAMLGYLLQMARLEARQVADDET